MDELRPVRGVVIPVTEVVVRAMRSSGPGGQHANVTASRIEASLDIAASPSLSEEHRRRLTARYGPVVRAIAQDTRSQARNRDLALRRLEERLALALTPRRTRVATKPTRGSRVRKAEAKRRQSERKSTRRRPDLD